MAQTKLCPSGSCISWRAVTATLQNEELTVRFFVFFYAVTVQQRNGTKVDIRGKKYLVSSCSLDQYSIQGCTWCVLAHQISTKFKDVLGVLLLDRSKANQGEFLLTRSVLNQRSLSVWDQGMPVHHFSFLENVLWGRNILDAIPLIRSERQIRKQYCGIRQVCYLQRRMKVGRIRRVAVSITSRSDKPAVS